jgi:GTP-dependent phosphoenolpyruvate carboxykinase
VAGFGANLHVLAWIMDRCINTADSQRTATGYTPKHLNIDMAGPDTPEGTIQKLTAIDKNDRRKKVKDIETFFKTS